MLLHFELNCFIIVMFIAQINLAEIKQKRNTENIDAFFDTSVDDLQDNFFDIPYVPWSDDQEEPETPLILKQCDDDELETDLGVEDYKYTFDDKDIFKFGLEELLTGNNRKVEKQINEKINNLDSDLEQLHELLRLKAAVRAKRERKRNARLLNKKKTRNSRVVSSGGNLQISDDALLDLNQPVLDVKKTRRKTPEGQEHKQHNAHNNNTHNNPHNNTQNNNKNDEFLMEGATAPPTSVLINSLIEQYTNIGRESQELTNNMVEIENAQKQLEKYKMPSLYECDGETTTTTTTTTTPPTYACDDDDETTTTTTTTTKKPPPKNFNSNTKFESINTLNCKNPANILDEPIDDLAEIASNDSNDDMEKAFDHLTHNLNIFQDNDEEKRKKKRVRRKVVIEVPPRQIPPPPLNKYKLKFINPTQFVHKYRVPASLRYEKSNFDYDLYPDQQPIHYKYNKHPTPKYHQFPHYKNPFKIERDVLNEIGLKEKALQKTILIKETTFNFIAPTQVSLEDIADNEECNDNISRTNDADVSTTEVLINPKTTETETTTTTESETTATTTETETTTTQQLYEEEHISKEERPNSKGHENKEETASEEVIRSTQEETTPLTHSTQEETIPSTQEQIVHVMQDETTQPQEEIIPPKHEETTAPKQKAAITPKQDETTPLIQEETATILKQAEETATSKQEEESTTSTYLTQEESTTIKEEETTPKEEEIIPPKHEETTPQNKGAIIPPKQDETTPQIQEETTTSLKHFKKHKDKIVKHNKPGTAESVSTKKGGVVVHLPIHENAVVDETPEFPETETIVEDTIQFPETEMEAKTTTTEDAIEFPETEIETTEEEPIEFPETEIKASQKPVEFPETELETTTEEEITEPPETEPEVETTTKEEEDEITEPPETTTEEEEITEPPETEPEVETTTTTEEEEEATELPETEPEVETTTAEEEEVTEPEVEATTTTEEEEEATEPPETEPEVEATTITEEEEEATEPPETEPEVEATTTEEEEEATEAPETEPEVEATTITEEEEEVTEPPETEPEVEATTTEEEEVTEPPETEPEIEATTITEEEEEITEPPETEPEVEATTTTTTEEKITKPNVETTTTTTTTTEEITESPATKVKTESTVAERITITESVTTTATTEKISTSETTEKNAKPTQAGIEEFPEVTENYTKEVPELFKTQIEVEHLKITTHKPAKHLNDLYNEIPVNRKEIHLSTKCESKDYLNKNHCICSVHSMLKDLMDDIKDINSTKTYKYDCREFIRIDPGIVIGNNSQSVMFRKKREDELFKSLLLKTGSRVGRDIESLLHQELEIKNDDNIIYAAVGAKVVIPCSNGEYEEDVCSEDFSWTVLNGSPETAGNKEDNGTKLVIERVTPQDSNNYSCIIKKRNSNEEPVTFLHQLAVVSLPMYSLMVTVLLNASGECQPGDLEVLNLYYPVIVNNLLCNDDDRVCSVSIDKPQCIRSGADNTISVHTTLKTSPLFTMLPNLNTKKCDLPCQSRVYSIIVETLLNNFASVTNLPG